MHDACLVLVLEIGDEFVGIDDDAFPSIVVAGVEIENQHAGLQGDDDAHQGNDFEAPRAEDALLGKEHNHALSQALELGIGVDRKERQ